MPFDRKAVFAFDLTNTSPAGDDLAYGVRARPSASNAQLPALGVPFISPVTQIFPVGGLRQFQFGVSPNLLPVGMCQLCDSITLVAPVSASFVSPRAEISWRGAISRNGAFVVNAASGNVLEVVASDGRVGNGKTTALSLFAWSLRVSASRSASSIR